MLRLALSLLAAVVVCLGTRTALAAAPLCDARAATSIAPTPTLDTQGGSVDATASDDCGSKPDRAFQRGHAPSSPEASGAPSTTVPAKLRILPAVPTAVLAHFGEAFTLPAGVRHPIERPPRA